MTGPTSDTGRAAAPERRRIGLAPARSAEEWDALVTTAGGCHFQRHAWLETMAGALDLRFRPEVVLADGEPVGVAPLLVKRVGAFSTINGLPFPYVGPLVPAPLLPGVLPVLAARERDLHSINSQHVLMSLAHPGPRAGYRETREHTFVLDLRGRREESLLRQVGARRRGQIRRAERAGVVVREASREEFCELLPAWSAATFTAQGLPPPYPAGCYRAVWSRFGGAADARFSTAVVDGRPVCVQATFADRTRAVGWTMASDKTTRLSSLALPLLYWDTIRWALRRGCAEFDLVGAPTEGVTRYKRQWGFPERSYSVLRRQSALHRVAMSLRARVVRQHGAPRPPGAG